MTPEKQRIVIAEFCEPEKYKPGTGSIIRGEAIWFHDGKYPITCKDYPNDLNAMHEAETKLHRRTFYSYVNVLKDI